jgi:hypothetical protein
MTTKVRTLEIEAAQHALDAIEARRQLVKYRLEYHEQLLDEGEVAAETVQQVSKHVATVFQAASFGARVIAGVVHTAPEAGAPTALKYGGKQLGDSAEAWADAFRDIGAVSESISSSAGLEASFRRRDQGWEHQAQLATRELSELDKQYAAADIRKRMAERALQIHEKTIEQSDELFELYNEKFSTLGLYTWLSASLQRLYRDAYNHAYAMAKLAEQAYRFERNVEGIGLIAGTYWDPARAGLLAGENLLSALLSMERQYLETNTRALEIDQAFSLTNIAPNALLQLKEQGSCTFDLGRSFSISFIADIIAAELNRFA